MVNHWDLIPPFKWSMIKYKWFPISCCSYCFVITIYSLAAAPSLPGHPPWTAPAEGIRGSCPPGPPSSRLLSRPPGTRPCAPLLRCALRIALFKNLFFYLHITLCPIKIPPICSVYHPFLLPHIITI